MKKGSRRVETSKKESSPCILLDGNGIANDRQGRLTVTRRSQPARSSRHAWGVDGFASPDNDAPASSAHPGQEQQQGQRQLQVSVQAIPSSNPMQALAMLEAIKDYGQAAAWAALVMDGEEIIPAGRSNWLQFVWLSHKKEQQRQVYEFIAGDRARAEATTFRLDAAHPSVN